MEDAVVGLRIVVKVDFDVLALSSANGTLFRGTRGWGVLNPLTLLSWNTVIGGDILEVRVHRVSNSMSMMISIIGGLLVKLG